MAGVNKLPPGILRYCTNKNGAEVQVKARVETSLKTQNFPVILLALERDRFEVTMTRHGSVLIVMS